jgi:hypothetical protein
MQLGVGMYEDVRSEDLVVLHATPETVYSPQARKVGV